MQIAFADKRGTEHAIPRAHANDWWRHFRSRPHI